MSVTAPARLPKTAMVMAAGLGLRLRPITLSTPKPLIKVAGATLIDHALDRLVEVGVERAVINLHHLGEQIERHLKPRSAPKLEFSWEREQLLETGGGIAKALPRLSEQPFFVVNADTLWLNGPILALERLAEQWDETRMDALLLFHPTVSAHGYDEDGDFMLDPDGRVQPREEGVIAPFVFTGTQIIHPRVFADAPAGPWRLRPLFDRLIAAGRLHALRHDGEWFHIGTPSGLEEAEAYLSERHPGRRGFYL